MSARASRRSQAAAAYGLPSVPIAEIRTRKWTKQIKTVGHLTIPKWIPDQEHPTEALQRGSYKKSKGRKRGAGEVGRMTRSVRQHLDAPLELLQEMTVQTRHSSRHSSPARATPAASTPARTPVPMPSPDALAAAAPAAGQVPVEAPAVPTMPAVPMKTEVAAVGTLPAQLVQQSAVAAPAETVPKVEPVAAPAPTAAIPMMPMMPPVSNQMMTDVPSDEQLEMVLDDLPMLDADDSFNLDALDPAFLPHPAPSHPAAAGQPGVPTPSETSQHASVDNSSTSVSEDEASANSGSSMPSMSPQSSPMMSRSPSP